jgi:hypothetical protein
MERGFARLVSGHCYSTVLEVLGESLGCGDVHLLGEPAINHPRWHLYNTYTVSTRVFQVLRFRREN